MSNKAFTDRSIEGQYRKFQEAVRSIELKALEARLLEDMSNNKITEEQMEKVEQMEQQDQAQNQPEYKNLVNELKVLYNEFFWYENRFNPEDDSGSVESLFTLDPEDEFWAACDNLEYRLGHLASSYRALADKAQYIYQMAFNLIEDVVRDRRP